MSASSAASSSRSTVHHQAAKGVRSTRETMKLPRGGRAPAHHSCIVHGFQAIKMAPSHRLKTRTTSIMGGRDMRRLAYLTLIVLLAALPQTVWAQQGPKWVVSWAASAHGPYPVGNPSAQPNQKFAFPSPAAGANDQTFRLIVRPGHLGDAGAAALHQRVRHQAGHLRRRLRRPADGRRRAGQGNEPAGHLRRQGQRHGGAWNFGLERRGGAHLRARPGSRRGARRAQARRQLPRRGRERPDDVARQGADHILRHRSGRRSRRASPRTRRRFPTARHPGSSSTPST